jgi:hypothetical protein
MVGKCAVIVIYRMPMDSTVSMAMSDDMAVTATGMIEGKADVIMTRVSGRRLRCGNADTLERKSERCRHHYNDGKASKKRLPRKVQRPNSSVTTQVYRSGAG